MINIRPVSDLRNKFLEIEELVKNGDPVYLTKNGYGAMVVMSMEQFSALIDETERRLDEADRAAVMSDTRYTEEEVFGRVRKRIHGKKEL